MFQDKNNPLIGLWRIDPDDRDALAIYGNVTMKFDRENRLRYMIHKPGKAEVIFLTYRIEGCWLVTDQPSSPREERTAFYIDGEGNLELRYQGTPARLVPVPSRESP